MSGRGGAVSVLVLGAHDTGKTTFLIQLLARLRHSTNSRLSLREALAAYDAYIEPLRRLEGGRAPEHTEFSLHTETTLGLSDSVGGDLNIVWPEYAGEQVQNLLRTRSVPEAWFERVNTSDLWVLFVRSDVTYVPDDVISRRIELGPPPRESVAAEEGGLSMQANLIELLQMLLYVRGVAIRPGVRLPVLAVMVSCFDLIADRATPTRPLDMLKQRVPLFADFVESVWTGDCAVVLGLSATGRSLDRDRPDVEFMLDGPHTQGYVVLPDGEANGDITLALSLPLDVLHGR